MMFPKIGPVELLLILVIVTMLFGVGKLPEVFGAVGRGVREFRKAAQEKDDVATTTTTKTETKSDEEAPVV